MDYFRIYITGKFPNAMTSETRAELADITKRFIYQIQEYEFLVEEADFKHGFRETFPSKPDEQAKV